MLVQQNEGLITEQYKAYFAVIAGKGYQEACLNRFLFHAIPSVSDIFVIDINEPFSEFYQLIVDILVDDDTFSYSVEGDEYIAAHEHLSNHFEMYCTEIKKEIWFFLIENDFVLREDGVVMNFPIKKVW